MTGHVSRTDAESGRGRERLERQGGPARGNPRHVCVRRAPSLGGTCLEAGNTHVGGGDLVLLVDSACCNYN
eukprot:364684-Chlamydomonas_euryale.AAC.2